MDEIKRNTRWTTPRENPEFNSGEVIVKENVTIKLKELVDKWVSNPGLIAGLARTGEGFDPKTLNIDDPVLTPGIDITDIEEFSNELLLKTKSLQKKAYQKAADKAADLGKERVRENPAPTDITDE